LVGAAKRKARKSKEREQGKRELAALERKSPPFAQNAKDGAPSRSSGGWRNAEKSKKRESKGNSRAQTRVSVPQRSEERQEEMEG
jgi:hypothetical protein